MKLRRLWFVFLAVIGFGSVGLAQGDALTFLYVVSEGEDSRICQFILDAPEDERCIAMPDISIGNYALSPTGEHIAFDNSENGQVYVVDLQNEEVTPLNLCHPVQEFLWDSHVYRAGLLRWSPDGETLAFTGVVSDVRCDAQDEGDVYLYDVTTQSVTNLTENLTVVRALIAPASWSPDGAWVTLYGAWSEAENERGYIAPVFRSAIIAPDGSQFMEIAPNFDTCRLIWSPDMRWFASSTNCYERHGGITSLQIIPFFSQQPPTNDTIPFNEIISPMRFGWRPNSTWTPSYGDPLWINDHTLMAYRTVGMMTFGYDMPDSRSTRGLVTIDVNTFSEVQLPDDRFGQETLLIENWFVSENRESGEIVALNPILSREFTIPEEIDTCPVSYALHIDAQGEAISVLNACVSAEATVALEVYSTDDFQLIWRMEEDDEIRVRGLGFFR